MSVKFPDSNTLEASVLKAIQSLGGSARTDQIDKFVSEDLELSEEQISQIRSGNRTEIKYRLAWIRTNAKNKGLITKVSGSTWRLTSQS